MFIVRYSKVKRVGPVLTVRSIGFGCALIGIGCFVAVVLVPAPHAAAVTLGTPNPSAQPPLLSAPGQFFSVPSVAVLDTRSGLGESSAQQLASGASLAVGVTGGDGVPADATSVVATLDALNVIANGGFLTAYDPDTGDSNVPSIGTQLGVDTSQTETIPVSAAGTIGLTNHTSASLDLKVAIVGYFTGDADSQPGDTYAEAGLKKIVDTTKGLGGPQAQIPAGGSVTFQVTGQAGIASGADTAVIQLSALNAVSSGYLTAYAAGGTDSGEPVVRYASGLDYSNLVYAPVSASGRVTVTNHGGGPVDLIVVTRGYFMPPATSTVQAEYVPIGPDIVYGSKSGGVTLAANASVTFQVTGAAGLPATGVAEVAENVAVTATSASGYLDVYRGDGTDPHLPSMYFAAPTGQTYVSFQDSLLSSISPTGQETVTNDSSGTLKVQVTVVGMYFEPQVPPVPTYLQGAATDTTSPTLSGIVQDSTGDSPTGEIFLFDSAGNPIGGSPTAVGQASSGERLSWPVTAGTLTDGDTYQWYMEACDQGVCSAPTATQTFTINTAAAPPPPTATATATITGSSITAMDAISDSGACSGSDCPLSSNSTIDAGSNGTNNWASSLKFNVSSIPVGSQIVSATLQLAEAGCLTGTSCLSTPLDVYQASSDVADAATGPALAAIAIPNPVTATAPASQGTWDITGFVQSWVAGSANDGLILQAAGPSGTGISYYSPTANVGGGSLPVLTVGYITPAVPDAPTSLNVTPGDGGVLVSWGNPSSWNYVDATGNAAATFTVTASVGSTVAATATTSQNVTALTGLTDGTPYTISVTATNPLGTGPAVASGSLTPVSISTGTSTYTQASNQYLDAVNELNTGQAANADAALAGDSQATVVSAVLSNQDLTNSRMVADMAANDQQDSNDTTSLSDSLVIPSAGNGFTEFTTATETFTTIDTSSGTAVDVPGQAENDLLLSFSASSGSPQLTGEVDADAAFGPVGQPDQANAFSDALDGPTLTAEDSGAPAAVASNSAGQFLAGSESNQNSWPCSSASDGGKSGGFDCSNQSAEIEWAQDHAYPGTHKDEKGFGDDCTDFVSRALHFGGGMPEDTAPFTITQKHDDRYWYQFHAAAGITETSYSWANSYNNADFFYRQGAHFLKYILDAKPGDIIYADWTSKRWSKISHAGVITKVTSKNVYITQHTNNRYNEPLFATTPNSWFGKHPRLSAWIVLPARKA